MLTGPQTGQLRYIMSASFTLQELDQMLFIRLDQRRLDHFAPGSGIQFQAFTIARDASMKGWDNELINALVAERPKNEKLLQIAYDLGISINLYDDTSQAKLGQAGLQTLVNADPLFNPSEILQGISKNKRCVCRIQVNHNGGVNYGTGFLVGPDLLLSNYHVFERVIDNAAAAIQAVTCKFDYEVAPNGTTLNPGIDIGLAAGNPILAFSKYDIGDTTGAANIDDIVWPGDKLDYALVKLERGIGEEAFGPKGPDVMMTNPEQKRGWISPSQNAPDLSKGKHMFIFQHPKKQPMKIAIGLSKVEGCDKNGNRVRYLVNTDNGSSGSPCFDHKFNWSALHNMGDPDWHNPYNQGIPAVKIVADLKLKNITL